MPHLFKLSCICMTLSLIALTLTACDDDVDVRNAPPEAEALGWCAQGDRDYLIVRVRDYERTPVDISIVVTSDTCGEGSAQGRLANGPTGSGIIGLASERDADGVVHLVEWGADVGEAGEGGEVPYEPCSFPEEPVLSATRGCCTRPVSLPDEITVRVYATDGDDDQPSPAETTLTRRVGCP